jgi:hypothetical protein
VAILNPGVRRGDEKAGVTQLPRRAGSSSVFAFLPAGASLFLPTLRLAQRVVAVAGIRAGTGDQPLNLRPGFIYLLATT